jgi:elongation factor Ts
MMTITAAQVFELRESTDCGIMDCKKALQEAEGDLEKAIEILRKKGIAKAAKKAERVTAEGIVKVKIDDNGKSAIILEINSETDFVAKDVNFTDFAEKVAQIALADKVNSVETLEALKIAENKTVAEMRQELVAKIGENVAIRRIAYVTAEEFVGSYVHGNRIGVLVALTGGDAELAKDIAMHIVASKPIVISPDQVAEELKAKEKDIFKAQALESGKPEHIVDKMVEGRLNKFLNEVSLVGQPFVKDPNVTIGKLLKEKKASVAVFVRFELGEGIEKKSENFAAEVMAQVQGS